MRQEARDYLCPLQIGLGVPAGAEAAVHATRQWMHRNSGHADKLLLKLDFRNAFNAVDREAVLREARLHLPEIACWADWCYAPSGRATHCHVELWSAARRPAWPRFQSGPLDLCFGYLDDVVLAGNRRQVTQALAVLTAAAARVGLVLEPSKSEVVITSPTSSADLRGLPAGFVRKRGDFTLLGAAVGAASFCNTHTATERVRRAASLMHALAELPDPQTALLLLRHCSAYSKVAYTMRVTPPAAHAQALL